MCPLQQEYPAKCVEEEDTEWNGDVEPGRECPVWLTHRLKKYFTGYVMAEKGLMPYSGGWTQQPYVWVKAFEVIGAEAAAVRREQLDELKQQRIPDE